VLAGAGRVGRGRQHRQRAATAEQLHGALAGPHPTRPSWAIYSSYLVVYTPTAIFTEPTGMLASVRLL
jgi:hypothetical protein